MFSHIKKIESIELVAIVPSEPVVDITRDKYTLPPNVNGTKWESDLIHSQIMNELFGRLKQ